MSLQLAQDNDVTLAVRLRKMGDNGRLVPATGLTVLGFVSTSKAIAATPIDTSLRVVMAETPALSGFYMGKLDGDKITTQWGPLTAAAAVYVHYVSGQDYHEVDTATVLTVRSPVP